MKFLLMMTNLENAWDRLDAAEQDRIVQRVSGLLDQLAAQNKLIVSHRLRPSTEAKTVRLLDNGTLVVTDGPFTETKEVMGGYCILECTSMHEAVEWATRLRLVAGAIEVRPIWE